jgi:PAS domain S-box-containing protein
MLADVLEEVTPQLCRQVPGDWTAPLLRNLVDGLRAGRVDLPACDALNKAVLAKPFLQAIHGLERAVYELIEERQLALSPREIRVLAEWFGSLRERVLGGENRRFAAMLDALPDHLFLQDPEGRMLYLNQAMAETTGRLTGLPREKLIGLDNRKFDVGDEFRSYVDGLRRRVLRGELVREQFQLPSRLGGFWREHHLAPVFDAEGRVEAIAVASRDIQERKKAQEELAQAVAFREQVMGILSHDLRNPLSSVLGLAELLQRQDVSERVRAGLVRIGQAAERMNELISTLLDVTRLRFRGPPLIQRERVDLDAIAHDVIEELRVSHPERRVVLVSDGDVSGSWDRGRIAQVVSNLTGNALTHGAADTPVRIALSRIDDDVVLEVSNRGSTIPADQLEHLFEPFWQPPDGAARPGGLGLGLYIVREITRLHGGTVAVRSRDGETAFTVRLPRGIARAEAHPH